MSVNYRMFALTPRMEPIEREGTTQSPASITVEIVVEYFIFDKHRIECNIIICNWKSEAP